MDEQPHTQAEASAGADGRTFWSVDEICKDASIHKSTLYLLLSQGVLEGRKIGRKTVITDESRRRWMASLPRFQSSAAA